MTDDDEQSKREHSQQSGSTLNRNEIGSSGEPKPLMAARRASAARFGPFIFHHHDLRCNPDALSQPRQPMTTRTHNFDTHPTRPASRWDGATDARRRRASPRVGWWW